MVHGECCEAEKASCDGEGESTEESREMSARHEPDAASRYLVETAAAFCTQEQVAKLLKVGVDTLRRHYGDELERGGISKTIDIAKTMYAIATDPENKSAANVGMWWLERRGGDLWKAPDKRVAVDVTTREAPPIIDSSRLSFEQRQQLREIVQACITVPVEPDIPALEHQGGDEDGRS
jgi:hypothetical protein